MRDIHPGQARIMVASNAWLAKVAVVDSGCWLWTGALTKNGYPKSGWCGRKSHRYAHRIALVAKLGRDLLPGETAGHKCHDIAYARGECRAGACDHRRCVNPDHLEPQSVSDNHKGGGVGEFIRIPVSHCMHGHPFNEENTYVTRDGKHRACRTCRAKRARDARRRNAA